MKLSGHESALRLAEESVRPGGELVQIGVYHGTERVPVALNGLVNEEISIQTVNARRESDWCRTLDIAPSVDLAPVVGPAFEMADYEDAFEAERAGVKIVLNP
ncbi:MDR/zinc-dependent alcohol dehydrogenase-like family protein [Halobellus captivus]|uniref:hypothetical protein n=1 Tax=Halobellus captivus TaxID=2592614 RepID=UPI001EF150E4|nr:hypothetical protein [Halobellus captivus]